MGTVEIEWTELRRLARGRGADSPGSGAGPAVLVVDLDAVADGHLDAHASGPPHGLHAVVVGMSADPATLAVMRPELCDVVVAADSPDLGLIVEAVSHHPVAAMTLVELLRCSTGMTFDAGLLAESSSYGVLQAGHEFADWKRERVPRTTTGSRSSGPVDRSVDSSVDRSVDLAGVAPVLARRDGDELLITLNRPGRRNALDAAMRDALVELLHLVIVDGSISRIVIDGTGPDFCSGGDLDEFGTAADVSVAHLVRLERSIARLLVAVSDRLVVRLHGACVGSGIELPAFASTVHAAPSTTIRLPELAMGLIPGAGGTVSLTRRIGRHRTCWLALTGVAIDAATALEWGLVDDINPSTSQR